MKSKFILFVSIFYLLINMDCADNSTNPQVNEITDETILHIKNIQKCNYELLVSLYSQMDTIAAKESILNVFLSDSFVESGFINSQAIIIEYKCGILGGIFINPMDDSGYIDTSDIYFEEIFSIIKRQIYITPNSNKTIFINPHYIVRKDYANEIINTYNTCFPIINYLKPEIYLDTAANVEVFSSLSNYGIIHIYSHGLAFPDTNNIEEVYVMTGENFTINNWSKYGYELKRKEIITPYVEDLKADKYCLSPKFYYSKNNFDSDTICFFGGFCFSFLGNWPNMFYKNTSAGSYLGFDWWVYTNYNSYWAIDFFKCITNSADELPMTVRNWFFFTDMPKYYSIGYRNVNIKFHGDENLTLWQPDIDYGLYGYTIYEYDEKNNMVKECEYYPNGALIWYIVYEYDNSGKKNKGYIYDENGNLINVPLTFEYDNNGNLIKQDNGGCYNTWEYDDKGNVIRSTFWGGPGDIPILMAFDSCIYDDRGKIIKIKGYERVDTTDQFKLEEVLIHYYDRSNIKLKSDFYDGDGNLGSFFEYEYDSKGKLIRENWNLYGENHIDFCVKHVNKLKEIKNNLHPLIY